MIILGLTGSIGMGKSTTAEMFSSSGVPVWDADSTVHKIYSKNGSAVQVIETVVPGSTSETGVNRAALKDAISDDPTVLKQIEAIVHPLVAEDRQAFLDAEREKGTALVVLDVPLLFETGHEKLCDYIAVVSVDAKTQRTRVLGRGTMTAVQFETILAKQLPDAEKRTLADFIIETATISSARETVTAILDKLIGPDHA
jgi:dephospho-CoA kinase